MLQFEINIVPIKAQEVFKPLVRYTNIVSTLGLFVNIKKEWISVSYTDSLSMHKAWDLIPLTTEKPDI